MQNMQKFLQLNTLQRLAVVFNATEAYKEHLIAYDRDQSDIAAFKSDESFCPAPGPKDQYVIERIDELLNSPNINSLTRAIVETYWSQQFPNPDNPINPKKVIREEVTNYVDRTPTASGNILGFIPVSFRFGEAKYEAVRGIEKRYLNAQSEIAELQSYVDKIIGAPTVDKRPGFKKILSNFFQRTAVTL